MNGRATTWGVFKAYAFFFNKSNCLTLRAITDKNSHAHTYTRWNQFKPAEVGSKMEYGAV